jgi:sphingosine kinase
LFTTLVKPILVAAGCEVVDRIKDGERGAISHVLVTSRPKEAIDEVSRINLDHYDAILCVGGDGTVHEVVNGLANRADASLALKRLPIGIIPAGNLLLDFSDIARIRY